MNRRARNAILAEARRDAALFVEVGEGAPNLDCMDDDALSAFAGNVLGLPLKTARSLFPARPSGYLRAARLLKDYALLTLTSRSLRLDGKVNEACQAEARGHAIYARLPIWARW